MISLWRFSQFAFSSELAFRAGGFPSSVEHMAAQVKVNRLKPRAPILYAYTVRSTRSSSMWPSSNLWRRIHEGLWTYIVPKFFITSRVPIRKKEFGSRYDEMMMKPMM